MPRLPEKPELKTVTGASTRSRHVLILLLAVMVIGGVIRTFNLRISPVGLNQDEAANAWNAYCLLKTGKDQAGVSWPIFYSHFFGENRSTLYMYWMLPFQAIGGLSIWTTRLPSAVAGILTLPLIFYIGARLFNRTTGLVAAAFLAITPWHIQMGRWGHEYAICPLLTCGTLAALLWANLPFDDSDRPPRPLLAGLAGAIAAISCYGYPAMRVFMPIFLLGIVLVTWRAWIKHLRTRVGRWAIVLGFIGWTVIFAPLAWKHISEPHVIGKRFDGTRAWADDASTSEKVKAVLGRYPAHFGLDFLFKKGDAFKIQALPNSGEFGWYMLPVMLVGIGVVAVGCRRSRSARVLAVWLLVYPVGDCLSYHESVHMMRSSPGLGALVLLGAYGCVRAVNWLYARRPAYAATVGTAFGLVVAVLAGSFLSRYFGEYNRDPVVYHGWHTDFIEACEWIKPRLDGVDAVISTTDGLNMPYMIMLVATQYDPAQWFRDPHEILVTDVWNMYQQSGKWNFVYIANKGDRISRMLTEPGKRYFLIVRPNQQMPMKPIHTISGPLGPAINIYEVKT